MSDCSTRSSALIMIPGETSRRVVLWVALVATPLGLAGVWAGRNHPLWWSLSLVLLLFGLVFAIAIPIDRRSLMRVRRQLEEMSQGALVAHWQYSDDEWMRYCEIEMQRTRGLVLPGVLSAAAVGTVGTLYSVIQGSAWKETLLTGFVVTLLLALAVGMVVWLVEQHGRRRCRRLENNRCETFIGEEGVYFDNQYHPFHDYGWSLQSITLEEDGAISVLQFQFWKNECIELVRVPVPDQEQATARDLVTDDEEIQPSPESYEP